MLLWVFLFVLANIGLNTYGAIIALLNKPQARSVWKPATDPMLTEVTSRQFHVSI